MSRFTRTILAAAFALLVPVSLGAIDPPHNISTTNAYGTPNYCSTCHKTHTSPGGALTKIAGNANLCLSCHVSGGLATNKAFVTTDQALPPLGLPTGTAAAGTSHRWDSGAAGRVVKGTPNSSTGSIVPSGAYTGLYPTTIQIKFSTAGQAGTAKFDWQMTINGTSTWGSATTAVATSSTGVALGSTGITLTFVNGTGTPSFLLNDIFLLYARNELRAPTIPDLQTRMQSGQLMCSTCHDQHSQADQPFDPSAPTTAGSAGRHFQRIPNNTDQMCVDCHAPRNVTAKGGTSHPVGSLAITATSGDWKVPTTAVLDSTKFVRCNSCHKVHYAPTADGNLLRVSNAANLLCDDCHTYRTAATKGVHFDATVGVIWPGGEAHTLNGTTIPASTFAARTTTDRGYCVNCHDAHGWPDAGSTTAKYPHMLVQNPSTLCLTCHDSTPTNGSATLPASTATNVEAEVSKVVRHPVERPANYATGRTVVCGDCHSPHKAVATPAANADSRSHKYSTTSTATRNAIVSTFTGPLVGVDGATPTFSATAWSIPTFTATSTATKEYEVCFKCHTTFAASFTTTAVNGQTTPAGMSSFYGPSTATATFTAGSATVTGSATTFNASMVGAWIRKTGDATDYRITAYTSATSLTITPAYAGTTGSSTFVMSLQTNVAQEFNPNNASYHPVTATLATTAGKSSPLQSAQMNAPWTAVGNQTMLCSDCHNTDSASTAAQGPHGSAVQFMLKGANPSAWPNVTLANGSGITSSWCGNCHNAGSDPHTTGDHQTFPCYYCHIVIPHGGRVGRLIATNGAGLPSRYAYNNDRTNVALSSFTKSTNGTYSQSGNCGTSGMCTYHSLSGGATW